MYLCTSTTYFFVRSISEYLPTMLFPSGLLILGKLNDLASIQVSADPKEALEELKLRVNQKIGLPNTEIPDKCFILGELYAVTSLS